MSGRKPLYAHYEAYVRRMCTWHLTSLLYSIYDLSDNTRDLCMVTGSKRRHDGNKARALRFCFNGEMTMSRVGLARLAA